MIKTKDKKDPEKKFKLGQQFEIYEKHKETIDLSKYGTIIKKKGGNPVLDDERSNFMYNITNILYDTFKAKEPLRH